MRRMNERKEKEGQRMSMCPTAFYFLFESRKYNTYIKKAKKQQHKDFFVCSLLLLPGSSHKDLVYRGQEFFIL